MKLFRRGVPLAAVAVAFFSTVLLKADPPAPPKVSAFAPAKEILDQVAYYMGRVESALASKDDYSEALVSRVQRESNTLVVLLLALGLHDEEHALKASGPGLVAAAKKLYGAAGDYDAAKAAYDELAGGMKDGLPGGDPLKWEKQYRLGLLMKQVTTVNTGLRRGLRKDRFTADADRSAPLAAAMAVFAQASLVDTHEVKNPDDLGTWYELNAVWRDSSGDIVKAVRAQNYEAASDALKRMTKSCDDCHAVFRKEEL